MQGRGTGLETLACRGDGWSVVFACPHKPPIAKQDVGEPLWRGEALYPKHADLTVSTVGSTRSERRWAKPWGSGSSPVGDYCSLDVVDGWEPSRSPRSIVVVWGLALVLPVICI
jgi:hypothetical protein